jgi:N-acetylmuramoyl-L-alanine amidase
MGRLGHNRTVGVIFFALCLAMQGTALAAKPFESADFLYAQARRLYFNLIDSQAQKAQRNQWLYCIQKFRMVRENYPGSSEAVKALFNIASLYQGMHRTFGDAEDLNLALTYYQMVEADPSQPQLADDALFQEGEIYRLKGNYIKASIVYENIVLNYADGDQAPRARQRLAEVQALAQNQIAQKKQNLHADSATAKMETPSRAPTAPKPEAPARVAQVREPAKRVEKKNAVPLIILDPGHGGKDEGAKGPAGLLEKEINLMVAKEVRRILEDEYHYRVELTRDDDTFIPVQERGGIANEKSASLFVSIHANAAKRLSATGIETYYLGFGSGGRAAETAARENGELVHSVKDDQVQGILASLIGTTKINDSSRLAARVQNRIIRSLSKKYGAVKNLGVKEGPFYVLHDTNMPSILVELGFVTNAQEESRLKNFQYRKGLAQAIAQGIHEFFQEREPAI